MLWSYFGGIWGLFGGVLYEDESVIGGVICEV